MAKSISLPEAGARLAEIVEEISATGEPVTITHRGMPVAVIVRPDRSQGDQPAADARHRSGALAEPEMLLDQYRALK